MKRAVLVMALYLLDGISIFWWRQCYHRIRSLLMQPLPSTRVSLLIPVIVSSCVLWSDHPARAELITGNLYYTTFYGSNGYGPSKDRLHSSTFNYETTNHSLSISIPTNITTNQAIGADGIIFAPDGKTLLVGGQSQFIYHVDPSTGNVLNSLYTGGVAVYHLALSPNGHTIYGGGSEAGSAGVAVVPTNPYGNGATESIRGSNSVITGIAFDANGSAYYTSSGLGGYGNFGTITGLGSSPVTQALLTNLPAAHGIVYDPFAGDFILVGSNEIAQVSTSGQIISSRTFSNLFASFDQVSVDGQGQLFVADNDGTLLFVDYSQTGKVGDASNYTSTKFLISNLDDIAPLVGPGGGGLATPEPSTLTLLGIGSLSLLGYGWRRRKQVVA
jgi:hypothetical protein